MACRNAETLTALRLRELLHYDPATGVFVWLVCVSRRVHIGDVAGRDDGKGYRRIGIDGRGYHAHRLAFQYMTGEWPKQQVDHINGDRADNRWANLREATIAENLHNVGKRRNNTSGFKGVHWCLRDRKWRAEIGHGGGRRRSLGYFGTPQEAHAAYCRAAVELHGEFARFK